MKTAGAGRMLDARSVVDEVIVSWLSVLLDT